MRDLYYSQLINLLSSTYTVSVPVRGMRDLYLSTLAPLRSASVVSVPVRGMRDLYSTLGTLKR